MNKYIKEWDTARIAETRVGEYGTAHICLNDLLKGDELEKRKESVSDLIYNILYRQMQNEATAISS